MARFAGRAAINPRRVVSGAEEPRDEAIRASADRRTAWLERNRPRARCRPNP